MTATRFAPRTALRRLGLTRWRPEAALVVPVPAASNLMAGVLRHGRATVAGLPPHVTLLYPFVPPAMIDGSTESTLADIAARFPPFMFQLARVARFPGVLYLEPDPAHPFVTLIEALMTRWPQHAPYGGRYTAVVPHVTVLTGREPPGLAQSLEEALPVECRAERVQLVVQDDDRQWQMRRDVLLGGAP